MNVKQFYDNLCLHFGKPTPPDNSNSKEFLENFREDVGGFDGAVYRAAAKKLRTDPEAAQFFPPIGKILAACVEADIAIKRTASSTATPSSEDAERLKARRREDAARQAEAKRLDAAAWHPDRVKAADAMMDSNIAREAASEGWIVALHDFCREQGRLPNNFEAEKVRAAALRRKAEREERERQFGGNPAIIQVVANAMAAKAKRLAALAMAGEGKFEE